MKKSRGISLKPAMLVSVASLALLPGVAFAQEPAAAPPSAGAPDAAIPPAPDPAQAAAPAQDAAGSASIQDIVVTARRVTERIQDTPVAITAFSGVDLTRRGANGLVNLNTTTPSLYSLVTSTSPLGLQTSIRGQVVTDTAANTSGSVGIYADDVFFGQSQIAGGLLNFEDLERVEVLKGPQGTLYGRNVTGGVVKFVANKPTDEFGGYVEGGYGNYNRYKGSAMINLPLAGDSLMFRGVATFDGHDGYSRDTLSKRDLDDLQRFSGRAQLLWRPSDRINVLLQGFYGHADTNGADVRGVYLQPGVNSASLNIIAAEKINGLTPAALAPIVFFGPAVANGTATPGQRAAFGAAFAAATAALPAATAFFTGERDAPRSQARQNPLFPLFTKGKTYGGDAVISAELGEVTIKSITGYTYGNTDRYFNVGGGSATAISTGQYGSNSQWTQEIQINGKTLNDRLTFALGGYYLRSSIKDIRDVSSFQGAFPLFLGQLGLGVTNGNQAFNNLLIRSTAFYGQTTYALTDTIHLTAGLRYTDESSSVHTVNFGLPSASNGNKTTCLAPFPTTAATPLDQCFADAATNFHNFSYTAGADWKITPDILLYAKTSRGFKAGGVNAFTTAGAPILPFKPETNTDYEAGIKSEFWNRRVRLNMSYYHTDYSNIQRTIAIPVASGVIATAVQNAASAKIDGVEVEAQVVPTAGFRLFGSLAYTDARYQKYFVPYSNAPAVLKDQSGFPFQGLAKYTYNVGGSYEFGLGPLKMFARTNWSHRSSAVLFENDLLPSRPGGIDFAPRSAVTQRAYGLLEASLSATYNNLTFTVWGKNVLNKRYFTSFTSLVNNGVGLTFGNFGEPATVGFDVKFKF